MRKNLLFAASAILLLTACFWSCGNDSEFAKQEQSVQEDMPVSRSYAIPIELDSSQEIIGKNMHVFSWKLFEQAYKMREDLAEANGHNNVLVSPFSLLVDLSMLQNGLKGETLEHIKGLLGVSAYSVDEINRFIKVMVEGIAEADDQISFQSANSFWHQDGLSVNPEFARVLADNYQAVVQTADFSNPETALLINRWCEENTNGKIRKIVDSTSPGQQYHLLNAIHFKGGWAKQFSKETTAKAPFHSANGSIIEVDMMNNPGIGAYYSEKDTYSFARLTFRYGAFDFFIVLPKEGYEVDDVLACINPDDISGTERAIVDLSLPKFEIEYGSDKMIDCLFGIDEALSFNPADTAIFTDHDAGVSMIIQKAYLAIDEEGAEAAAVTDITNHINGGNIPIHAEMHLDRPFVYGIVETSTNMPLFIGYYGN